MTDSVTSEIREEASPVRVPTTSPPAFLNSVMRLFLRTPGLQRWLGKGLALLTFTGRHTGAIYTIPVSYSRQDDTVVVITKRLRNWWRNFETPAEVELRIAGREYHGKAEITLDDEANLDFMTGYLADRPIDAKAYGLAKTELTREKVAPIIPHIVVIRVHLAPAS